MSRRLLFGLAAALLYGGTAMILAAGGGRVLPLFDGQAPPAPYRWVDPPGEFADTNQPAASGRIEYPLDTEGPVLLNAFTDDGQAVLSGSENVFEERAGQGSIEITLTPLDPETLGPPPGGLMFDGNAYRVEATYRPSGEPAPLKAPATLVLRYPVHATEMLQHGEGGWTRLAKPNPLPAALQVFAEVTELGTFVAAGPDRGGAGIGRWLAYGAAALAILAVILYPFARKRFLARRARTKKKATSASKKKKKKGRR